MLLLLLLLLFLQGFLITNDLECQLLGGCLNHEHMPGLLVCGSNIGH